jgi:5-(carboxyamino)imidazole ribonucleotide synthase
VLGLPLGSTRMDAPAAAMVNLLAADKAPGRVDGLNQVLAVPGAHVHLYGKATSGPGRKMGHITALAKNLSEAEEAALKFADHIQFGTIS